MNVTINGNIVTLHDLSEIDILMEIQKRNLTQYVALGTDLSFPMNRLYTPLKLAYNPEFKPQEK